MKNFERIISFLLAVVMVFGMLPPMAVHAEETEPTQSVTEVVMDATEDAETETETAGELPEPVLTYRRVVCSEDGLWGLEDWDETANGGLYGEDDLTFSPGEYYLAFYLNTWDPETESWEHQPVHVEFGEYLDGELMEEGEYVFCEDAEDTECYYYVTVREENCSETISISFEYKHEEWSVKVQIEDNRVYKNNKTVLTESVASETMIISEEMGMEQILSRNAALRSKERYVVTNPNNITGQTIVDEARKWANVKAGYYEGSEPWPDSVRGRTGYVYENQIRFDCSGFVSRILNDLGLRGNTSLIHGYCVLSEEYGNNYISSVIEDLCNYGENINAAVQKAKDDDYSDLQPGDLIGWVNSGRHIIIYAGKINGEPWMVEWTGSGYYYRAISKTYQSRFESGARLVPFCSNHTKSDEYGYCLNCTKKIAWTVDPGAAGTYKFVSSFAPRVEPYDKADSIDNNFSVGSKVTVTGDLINGRSNRWYEVKWGNNKTGYVYYKHLEKTGDPIIVKYNANGGSGAPAEQTKVYGSTLTLSSTKPTRAGYTFKGWSASSTATSATYPAGGQYTSNASITLYAVWEAHTCQKGEYLWKWDAHPHYSCYRCTICGTDSADYDEPNYDVRCEICNPPESTYTINLYPNGASDANSSFTVVKGNSIGTLPAPRFDNMSFEGWYTEPFGGSKVTTATVPTGDMNLYAHYTYNYASQTKLEFDANGGTLPGPVISEQINGVNMWRSTASLVVYNQSGTTVNTNENGVEAAIDANGRVVAIREEYDTGNKLTVPEGGFVISGHIEHVDGGVIGGCHFVWSVIRSPDAYVALDYETGTVTLYDSHAGYLAATKMCGDYTRYGDLPVPTRSGYVFQGWTVNGYDAAYYSGYGGYKLKASWAAEDDLYRADEMVYNGHLYERYDSIVSWTKAKELCEAKGGHLVTITDADEQSAVAAFAAKGKRGIYRIGATDEGSEGTWRWVTGEPFAYNNWDKSTPEPSNGDGENYANIVAAALSLHNKEVGEWFDDADVKHTSSSGYYDLSNTGFICEYEYDNTCDHAYSYSVQKEPTEKASGVLRYKCSSCGDYTDSTLPALNKSDYGYSVSSAPGCTEVGTGTYMWTTDSGDTFDFSVTLPATGHSYTSKYTEASCDSYGYTTYTCSACGDSYVEQDEEGWSNWSETYPSNASKVESRTEYRYQDKETTTSTQSSMPGWELYHTTSEWGPYGAWSEWDDDAITATDSTKVETRTVYGYKYFLCPNCGAHMHGTGTCYSWAGGCGKSFSGGWHEIWSPVSWDAAGLKDWHGTGDYYTYLDGELVFKWKESSSKTQYRSCSREKVNTYHFYRWTDWSDWSATQYTAGDNRQVETRTVYRYLQELPGHSYSYKITKKPTEAAAGTLTGTCGSCGATTTVTLPKLTTADYSYKVTKAASCNAEGAAQYTWKTTTYGSFSFDVTLSKSDHNYTGKVTAPNCTEKGYTTHTCSGCGDSYVDTYVNALGHDYKDGTCTRCGVKDPDYVETIAGTCGENLTWTLDQDGTLTISGTGDMTDFAESKQAWAEHMDDIRYVVVENGVSSISKIAFAGCSSLETVRIPDSVSTIGSWAFRECTNLTEVKIGNGVTVIDKNTFILCSSLKTVTLGNKVEEIAYSAFKDCEALENINFPDSLKKIDRYAFFRCESLKTVTLPKSFDTLIPEAFLRCAQLKRINVVAGNTTYCSVDGVVYLKDQTVVVAVPNGLEGSLTVLEGVTTIAESAFFYCDKLSEVVLPDSLEQIGVNAFCQCRALTRMNIPGNVTLVDAGAFYDCKNLKEIKFGKTAPVFQNNVFYGVQATAYYPDGQGSWTENVGQNYGGTITWIAYDPCETGHAYENSLTAPNCTEQGYTTHTCSVCGDSYVDTYVNALGHDYQNGVCLRCGGSDPNVGIVSSGTCGDNLSWTLNENGVLIIKGTGLMYNYRQNSQPWDAAKIKKVIIQNGATSIGDYAFYRCLSLNSISIPSGVTSVGANAFYYCQSLRNITLPDTVTSIGGGCFDDCEKLTSFVIPDGVKTIAANTFKGCHALISVEIPDSVTSIGATAFWECFDLKSVVIPDGVTSIGVSTFQQCNDLCSVVIPKSVTSIGNGAFQYCGSLASIEIPEKVATIGNYAFSGCTALKEITFKGNMPATGRGVFYKVTANALYPGCNSTWSEDAMIKLGGTVTWVPACEDGHVLTMHAAVAATCIKDGFTTGRECSVCGTIVEPQVIASLGHAYVSKVTEPTCSEQGYTTHTCSACGDSYVDSYVEVLGHDYQNGVCTVCGENREKLELEVVIPGANKSGAVVMAPEGGWKLGTNSFSVSCEKPCVVAVSYDCGETYVRLTATAADTDYSFTAENMTADTIVAVAVMGDTNGDGNISNADVTKLRAAVMGKADLDSLTQLAVNVNGDAKITNADVTKLRAVFFGKTALAW